MSDGTHVITLAAVDSAGLEAAASITIEVIAAAAPTVGIVRPDSGSDFPADEPVGFEARASDTQDGTLSGASLVWVSDIDGILGVGEIVSLLMSEGTHTVVVTATNSLNLSAQDSVMVQVGSGPGVPVVTLSSPADNASFSPVATITFEGSATDAEDGVLLDSNFTWCSDHDGVLGTGRTLETMLSGEPDPCDLRTHVITLEVTDSDGNTSSQVISVKIRIVC